MRWRLAVFDRDGTLIDTLTVAYAAVCEIFKVFAPDVKPPTLEEYRREVTADFKHFYYAHGIPRKITPDEMDEVRVRFFAEHKRDIKPYPFAHELLSACRKLAIQTGIVSASPEDLEKEFAEWGLLNSICHIIGLARDKENALVETLNFFGIKAEEAFYCDDSFDGLTAAKNVGMGTIGITHGYNPKDRIQAAEPDFTANSLLEVIEILKTGGEQ